MKLELEAAQQLNDWAENNQDVTNQEVIDSEFYNAMQTTTNLNTARSNLTSGGLMLLANIVANSPVLTNLSMFDNNICNDAVAFATIISKSTSLTHLDVQYNHIGNNSAAFVNAISYLTSLTYLDIAQNIMSIDNTHSLVKALISCPNLQTIIGFQTLFNQVKHADNLVKIAVHNTLNVALLEYLPSELINVATWHAGNNEEEIGTVGDILND